MTLQELIDWAAANDVPLTAPIAIRHKDDVLLVEKSLSTDYQPYFGNCPHGDAYIKSLKLKEDPETGEYLEPGPKFLMLGTGY